MCEPISISAAIAASLATAQAVVQNEAAKDYNDDLEDATRAEMGNAKIDAQNQQAALSQQQLEQSQALAQEKQALARELLSEQATARTGAAEGGIGGVSKIRSFITNDLQAGAENAIINQNENNARARDAQRNQAILDQYQGRTDASQASFTANAQGIKGFGAIMTDAAIAGGTAALTAGAGSALAGAFSSSAGTVIAAPTATHITTAAHGAAPGLINASAVPQANTF